MNHVATEFGPVETSLLPIRRTASEPMEVELRNESEMPADFNWKIPLNMEACHLVSTNHREKHDRCPSVV